MELHTIFFVALIGACCTACGVAVGKMWGSWGKQDTLICETNRRACRETLEVRMTAMIASRDIKFDSIIERLRRIEGHVLNNVKKME